MKQHKRERQKQENDQKKKQRQQRSARNKVSPKSDGQRQIERSITEASHMVTHYTTGSARTGLTSQIGRDTVLYRWYERICLLRWLKPIRLADAHTNHTNRCTDGGRCVFERKTHRAASVAIMIINTSFATSNSYMTIVRTLLLATAERRLKNKQRYTATV